MGGGGGGGEGEQLFFVVAGDVVFGLLVFSNIELKMLLLPYFLFSQLIFI